MYVIASFVYVYGFKGNLLFSYQSLLAEIVPCDVLQYFEIWGKFRLHAASIPLRGGGGVDAARRLGNSRLADTRVPNAPKRTSNYFGS